MSKTIRLILERLVINCAGTTVQEDSQNIDIAEDEIKALMDEEELSYFLHEKMDDLNNDDDFQTPFSLKLAKAIKQWWENK